MVSLEDKEPLWGFGPTSRTRLDGFLVVFLFFFCWSLKVFWRQSKVSQSHNTIQSFSILASIYSTFFFFGHGRINQQFCKRWIVLMLKISLVKRLKLFKAGRFHSLDTLKHNCQVSDKEDTEDFPSPTILEWRGKARGHQRWRMWHRVLDHQCTHRKRIRGLSWSHLQTN